MDLVTVSVESSISPPIPLTVTDADLGLAAQGGAAPGPGEGPPPTFSVGRVFAMIMRPKVTIDAPVVGHKVVSPYGEPLPWQIFLPVAILAIGFLSATLWHWAQKWWRS